MNAASWALAVVAAIVAIDLLAVFALMQSAKRADEQADAWFERMRPVPTLTFEMTLLSPPPLERRDGFEWDLRAGRWVPLTPLLEDLHKARFVDDVLGGGK